MKAIEAHQLTRNYKSLRAVDQISFSVEPGEICGFLGPNGAGKTTTIKMLTGQLRPTAGSASVAGWDIVNQRDQLKPCIGVVFEYQNIYERLSARDNLLFSASLYGVARERVDQVIEIVGLADWSNQKAQKLSNGMKQRLLIARALLHEPEIIFMDEPTKGLDPGVARAIRKLISDLSQQGVTIFLTTHYMEEADQLSDRVAILDQGRIVALNAPDQLKAQQSGENTTLEDVFIALTGKDLYR
jgi:ABC-2 type transport system ATP-binding protein